MHPPSALLAIAPPEDPRRHPVSDQCSLLIALPSELSDEAAAQLLKWLHELAAALESQYTAQLLRYYHRDDERQQPLWPDDDPPF